MYVCGGVYVKTEASIHLSQVLHEGGVLSRPEMMFPQYTQFQEDSLNNSRVLKFVLSLLRHYEDVFVSQGRSRKPLALNSSLARLITEYSGVRKVGLHLSCSPGPPEPGLDLASEAFLCRSIGPKIHFCWL